MPDTATLPTDARIARSAVLSRRLRWVVWGLLGICGLAALIVLVMVTGAGGEAGSFRIGGENANINIALDGVSGPVRLLLIAPFLPSGLLVLAVLWATEKLLRLYEQDQIFGPSNAKLIHQCGKLLVALAVVNTIASPVAQALGVAMGLADNDISIEPQLGLFLIRFAIIVVGHIMSLGAEMAEERALTI
tara:strand:- start:207 stop:776 length:570 start_codon:yes stop_codon:yes gene_type:complete